MNSNRLKQSYCKHLVKVGVTPRKAKQAAKALTIEELQMIGEIWADWASVLSQTAAEAPEKKNKRHPLKYSNEPEVHRSAYCKIKRTIDLIGGFFGILLTGIICIPVAVAMQFDSPGPFFILNCGVD